MFDKALEQSFSINSARISKGILEAYMRFCEARIAFDTALIGEGDLNNDNVDISASVKKLLAPIVRHMDDSIDALKETKIQFEYLKSAVPCFCFTREELTVIGAMLISEGAIPVLTAQKISNVLQKQGAGDMISYLESKAISLHDKMEVLRKEFSKTHHRKFSSYLKNDREPNILVDMGTMAKKWGELNEILLFMRLAYISKIFGKMNFSRVLWP